jgi:hypothetical protein
MSDLFKKLVNPTQEEQERQERERQERKQEIQQRTQQEQQQALNLFPRMIQENNRIKHLREQQERKRQERENRSIKGKVKRVWNYLWDLN